MKFERKTLCECLYSDAQEIYCVSKHGDAIKNTFTISVERDQRFSATTTSITVKVDDMLKSFVFYSGKITRLDYEKIKAEHGLLIDFEDFIGHLINLLKKSNKNCDNEEMVYTLQLDYSATGEIPEYSLQVMETNNLRKFCHLSISLTACDDKEIRETLCKNFKQLQDVNDSLGEELRKKTEELQALKTELQEKTATLATVNKLREEDVEKMRLEYADSLSREKERMDKFFSECNEKNRAELVQCEEQHTREKHDLECRLKELTTKLRESDEKCRLLKLNNEELSGVVERLQETEKSTRRELIKLKSQIEAKDSLMMEKQATRRVLVVRYKALLQDFSLIAEKVKILQGRLDSSTESEAKLRNQVAEGERRLQEVSDRAARAELRLQQVEAELSEKSADVGRLQAELASKDSALRSSEGTATVLSRQLRQLQLQQQRTADSRAPALRWQSAGSCREPLNADAFRREPQPAAVTGATSSYFYKRL